MQRFAFEDPKMSSSCGFVVHVVKPLPTGLKSQLDQDVDQLRYCLWAGM